MWPRLVGAELWRRILTQRREDAEGRRADGARDGAAEVGGTDLSLSSLSFSFSGSARSRLSPRTCRPLGLRRFDELKVPGLDVRLQPREVLVQLFDEGRIFRSQVGSHLV